MHTQEWPSLEIDHKDRNILNNSFSNLNKVTSRQNQLNRSNNVAEEFRNIELRPSGNYTVKFYSPQCKKYYNFGTYPLEKATKVRDLVELRYHNIKQAKEDFLKGTLV